MERTQILCFPTFQHHSESSKKDLNRASYRGSDNAGMEVSTMVSKAAEMGNHAQTGQDSAAESSNQRELGGRPWCMGDIKDQLLIEGLDKRSAQVYMGSWRPATIRQYDTYLEKWTIFCVENAIHPRIPSLIDIMKFLTWLSCKLNMSYSVNSARSALSAYAQNIGGHPVGSHPEIVRHIKGFAKSKPPKAKLATTWDVNTVFILIKNWHPLSELSILQLTFKTVMLLVLVLAQRAQTIAMMRISGLTWLEERVLIEMQDMLKHNREKKNGAALTPILVAPAKLLVYIALKPRNRK